MKTQDIAVEDVNAKQSDAFVYWIAAAAAIAGLLFGFDTAVINGALVFLRQEFQLTEFQTELAASSLLVGCLLGASGAGSLSDRFGRRRMLLLAAALFGFSSVGTALPHNLGQFLPARFVAGVAIGVASVLAPMYISEISPARIRGRLVTLNQMAIVTGILGAYCINWLLSGLGTSSWRWMFAVGVLPSLVFFIALLFIPESPRWLMRQGQDAAAMRVLQKISAADAETAAEAIRASLIGESGTLSELLAPHLRKPLLIAIALAVLSQVTGINTVIYYGSILLRDHAGQSSASDAIGANITIGLVNFVCTIFATTVIDSLGRKALLLAGSAGMAVSLGLLGVAFRVTPPPTTLILAAVLFYVGFFAISLGPASWVYISELFPTAIRGRAMSLATLCLWAACLLVTMSFLSLVKLLSPAGAFWLYAGLCVLAFLFVWRFTPETKGRSLEEIQKMWTR